VFKEVRHKLSNVVNW